MAAYGALVSVMQILDQIHRHPRPPISLDKNQFESLTANVTLLQEFLEGYNPHRSYTSEADPLESRIAEAAYAAEDVIESYIVDQILSRSTDHAEEISSIEFYQGLQKVIEEMDVIKMEIKKIVKEKKMGFQIMKKSTIDGGSSRSSSTAQKVTTIVGFDDVLYEMLDKITGGERVHQIIPIVGMGGLGKTTLARNIFENPLINEHFDIRAWSTISQVINSRKILSEILVEVDGDDGGDLNECDLGVKLYQHLIGKKYLIVMDDMWSIEAWDVVRKFFPDNGNGSRVVVTTRLSNLASMLNYSDGLDMDFLDEASSWDLFSQTVFGEEFCPPELEDIGKKIVEGCRGLPLSIVVVGGLLSKSEATRENWELIEKNLNSIVNTEDDGSCLQILYMSYNNLPAYLKPCFLHFALSEEDDEIMVSTLIPLWVAEGFIKPIDGKSLEEAAEKYLEELVDRNLLLAGRNYYGKLELCKMHDLLRDICLREAQKDKFLCVLGEHSIPADISAQRRIFCPLNDEYPPNPLIESLEPISSSRVRTLIGNFPKTLSISSFRLLRVCQVESYYDGEEENSKYSEEENSDGYYENIFFRLVNLRLLVVNAYDHPLPRIPSSVSFLWNLQTLFILDARENCLMEIWKMPLLRHVIMTDDDGTLCLPLNPPLCDDDMNEVVLENLHTLFEVSNLHLGEGMLRRIPNIKILELRYYVREGEEEEVDYCLNNLHRLQKLQVLCLSSSLSTFKLMQDLTLPHSLMKLTFRNTQLPWEEITVKIGCLPLLRVLNLDEDSFLGSEWETVEGQFSSLNILSIYRCTDLEHWITDKTHFPRLTHLDLNSLTKLKEVPSSIGDIPTLRFIRLVDCSDIVVESARRILEEQEDVGNQDIELQVY